MDGFRVYRFHWLLHKRLQIRQKMQKWQCITHWEVMASLNLHQAGVKCRNLKDLPLSMSIISILAWVRPIRANVKSRNAVNRNSRRSFPCWKKVDRSFNKARTGKDTGRMIEATLQVKADRNISWRLRDNEQTVLEDRRYLNQVVPLQEALNQLLSSE